MPLPIPNEGESENDFIARCMSNETMNTDFPQQAQRLAVCFRQWHEVKGIEMDVTATEVEQADTTGTDEIVIDEMPEGNALKAISRTDDELRVGNRIIVFGGRDLEGVGSPQTNADGSLGEYFTADTDVSSIYTKAGVLYEDWEHAGGEAGDDLLGIVDWKTAKIDDKGIFVERVLSRRNQYVQWLDELGWFDNGMLGTSSQADPNHTEKAADGQILKWPLVRDTITVAPMEPRMMTENNLAVYKSLGIPVPGIVCTNIKAVNEGQPPTWALNGEPIVFTQVNGKELLSLPNDNEPEQEPEASPEADTSAVDVARAKAKAQQFLISLMEE